MGKDSLLHVVLYQPEIPQNTGNIGRMCSIVNIRLHLIYPLGFKLTDKAIRRSGMDYWHDLDVVSHESWDEFIESPLRPKRLWLFTTKSENKYWDVPFQEGDGLLFGSESSGVSQEVRDYVGSDFSITIPHFNHRRRSLNLATSAGIAVYEGLRQITS